MVETNPTIQQQLAHRSVREFEATPLSAETLTQLVDVAQHAASSHFLQAYSIIDITDPTSREALAQVTNQPYVDGNGQLFLFVADQYRNFEIAGRQHAEEFGSTDKLMQAISDALIAAQNMTVAAESLGLGAVMLGSILNDAKHVIDLLHLPKLTFPIVGVMVGHPAEKQELKPRLPQALMRFTDQYALPDTFAADVADYDQDVKQYYVNRHMNPRKQTFSELAAFAGSHSPAQRHALLAVLKQQGFFSEPQE